MDSNITFSYKYSAKENKEIQEIRKKYLPKTESKLEELKRLDHQVQIAGQWQSLVVGIVGLLVFGLGMCLGMQVIGNSIVMGVLVGVVGMTIMFLAFPVYRWCFCRKKEKLSPRILELAAELTNQDNVTC